MIIIINVNSTFEVASKIHLPFVHRYREGSKCVIVIITYLYNNTLLDFVKSNFGFLYKFRKEVLCVNNIKERLTAMGKSQVWLLRKLREKGLEVQPPQLCNIINGNYTYPKAQKVLEICNDVLTEVENAT